MRASVFHRARVKFALYIYIFDTGGLLAYNNPSETLVEDWERIEKQRMETIVTIDRCDLIVSSS